MHLKHSIGNQPYSNKIFKKRKKTVVIKFGCSLELAQKEFKKIKILEFFPQRF